MSPITVIAPPPKSDLEDCESILVSGIFITVHSEAQTFNFRMERKMEGDFNKQLFGKNHFNIFAAFSASACLLICVIFDSLQ